MIEIVRGSLEEQIIKILQKTYPITIKDIINKIHISKNILMRELKKLHSRGIIQLEPLRDKTFIRLQRNDFRFVGKKQQRKFIKHHKGTKHQQKQDYDGIMYS